MYNENAPSIGIARIRICEGAEMRMTCRDCKHWKSKNGKWGKCPFARTGLFLNHTKHGSYVAYHTQSRQSQNKACKKHFEEKEQ
jgi:hypothetical protein